MNEQKNLGEVMAAYALMARDFACDKLKMQLDFSEQSVETVEKILARFHDEYLRKPPPEGIFNQTCMMWGAYIGEVMRKRLGADWVLDTKTIPGKQVACLWAGTVQIWPPAKVHKRIVNGPQDNVWCYFQFLVEQCASDKSV